MWEAGTIDEESKNLKIDRFTDTSDMSHNSFWNLLWIDDDILKNYNFFCNVKLLLTDFSIQKKTLDFVER